MAKHTIEGALYFRTEDYWDAHERIVFYGFFNEELKGTAFIKLQTIEVEVPDDFDPRSQQIAALKKKQRKAAADFEKLCTDTKRQISELSAIEYVAAV
jgi:hypothetical protein